MDDRIDKLERDLRLFKRYGIGMTLAFGALMVVAFRQPGRTKFTEIDVERVNIVEADGRLRLAISNSMRASPIMFYGKEYPGLRGGHGIGGAGMIYFNDEGTENGGFMWQGRRNPDGTYLASGLLTFDQYNQGEALALSYGDNNGQRRAGLSILDQPEGSVQPHLDSLIAIDQIPDSAERAKRRADYSQVLRATGAYTQRLYVGKDATKSSLLTLADPQGRTRLRLSVDSLGTARLEFLDENGKVSRQLLGQ